MNAAGAAANGVSTHITMRQSGDGKQRLPGSGKNINRGVILLIPEILTVFINHYKMPIIASPRFRGKFRIYQVA